MTKTFTLDEINDQLKKIRDYADFVKNRSVEQGDDRETQQYSTAYAAGMKKAADELEEYLSSKEY